MEKKNLLELKKKIIGYSSLALASTMTLAGCSYQESAADKAVENASAEISENNAYYVNSPRYFVIEVQNVDGSTKKHLVKHENMDTLKEIDSELYAVYKNFDHYATLYVDVLTNEVVAIKYDIDYESTKEVYGYAIRDVLEEKVAINYTNEYYGIRESYTYEELYYMMEDLNNKEKVKGK